MGDMTARRKLTPAPRNVCQSGSRLMVVVSSLIALLFTLVIWSLCTASTASAFADHREMSSARGRYGLTTHGRRHLMSLSACRQAQSTALESRSMCKR